jgi:exodeoxyribonuclease-5
VAEGERVICLRNCRELGLYNGQQGIATGYRVRGQQHVMDFESNDRRYERILVRPDQFGAEKTLQRNKDDDPLLAQFDYAYIISCHKAQGDEFGTVLVLEERCRRWDHKRWTYTAASRATDKVYWASEDR